MVLKSYFIKTITRCVVLTVRYFLVSIVRWKSNFICLKLPFIH